MKTNLLRSLFALLALSFAAQLRAETTAASSVAPAGEIAVHAVAARVPVNGDTVTRGTSRVMVSMRLGSPSAVLPDGSWVYRGYTAQLDAKGRTRNGALIVRFAASLVESLSLADDATVVALREKPKSPGKTQLLAAADRR